MIEKLDIKNGGVEDLLNCIKKINELVDAVNLLQCKNVHIESDLQDLMYPKEIKGELAENVQPDYVTTTYPTDGHTQEYFCNNEFCPSYDETDSSTYNILIRTRKALDVAVDALTRCQNNTPDNYTATQAVFLLAQNSVFIDKALEQITTLEQKDKK